MIMPSFQPPLQGECFQIWVDVFPCAVVFSGKILEETPSMLFCQSKGTWEKDFLPQKTYLLAIFDGQQSLIKTENCFLEHFDLEKKLLTFRKKSFISAT